MDTQKVPSLGLLFPDNKKIKLQYDALMKRLGRSDEELNESTAMENEGEDLPFKL
ncbi:hypothetical protein [Paenibacillus pabuli]|uniref:hypothetical protein n=1 Tax=Paenibacillus pabuli TaxID=1472 RepID=UPI001FFF628D|nr:hypothetical protein [Paenibacillus pabuli]UPK41168.1 hypothetical protein KET34_17800 [Paenibacillus pabuli]